MKFQLLIIQPGRRALRNALGCAAVDSGLLAASITLWQLDPLPPLPPSLRADLYIHVTHHLVCIRAAKVCRWTGPQLLMRIPEDDFFSMSSDGLNMNSSDCNYNKRRCISD